MTEQELSQIPFRMVSHLAMETEHICVYESQNPLYKIRVCKHTKKRRTVSSARATHTMSSTERSTRQGKNC